MSWNQSSGYFWRDRPCFIGCLRVVDERQKTHTSLLLIPVLHLQVLRMLEGEMIFDANSSPASGYFAGRLNNNHMTYYPVAGPAPREEVKYPNFVSPQSEYNSKYSSPNRKNGNLPYGPMISSPKVRHSSATKDSIKKLPVVASHLGQDGQKLSYEALRAAYMDKVSPHHVTASAYESYQLGKDF